MKGNTELSLLNLDGDIHVGPYSKYPIRLALLAPDEVLLAGLRTLVVRRAPQIVLVGEALGIDELRTLSPSVQPSVIVVDARHLEEDPRSLAEISLQLPVLLVVDSYRSKLCREALELGVRGLMLQSEATTKLTHAIERLHAGDSWIPNAILRLTRHCDDAHELQGNMHRLTPSELETTRAMLEFAGAKNFLVAQALKISESTLRNRLTVIYDKLGLPGKAALVLYARENGLHPAYL